MPDTKPRGAAPASLWVTLGVAGLAAAAVLVGSFIKAPAVHRAVSIPPQQVQTESPAEASTITRDVYAQEQRNAAPQGVPAPPAQPVRSAAQQDPAITEDRRQRLQLRREAALAPNLGIPPQWMMQAREAGPVQAAPGSLEMRN